MWNLKYDTSELIYETDRNESASALQTAQRQAEGTDRWDPRAGVVVQPLSHVCLTVTPLTAASQASLSFTISWSLLKFVSIESVMPSNHLILCHPLLLLPSIAPSIRVFSSESALRIRWPKYCRRYSRLIHISSNSSKKRK